MTSRSERLISSALTLASMGIPVMPIVEKRPILKDWPNTATIDPVEIKNMFEGKTNLNLGAVMGSRSKLLALDIDIGKGGYESLSLLENMHEPLPPTIINKTPTGGVHYLFRYDGDDIGSSTSLDSGIDIRCNGGQIAVPPSIHPKTKTEYEFKEPFYDINQVAILPTWLSNWIKERQKTKNKNPQPFSNDGKIYTGSRHDYLLKVAGSNRRHGLDRADLLIILQNVNKSRCHPPLEDEQVERIAYDIGNKSTDSKNIGSPLPLRRQMPKPEAFPLHALGYLRPVVEVLRESIQAPDAICAQSVLAAACLATQALRNVTIDGRTFPISGNFLTVGESGERKTAIDKIVNSATHEYELELHDYYDKDYSKYKIEVDAYNHVRNKILRGKKKTRNEIELELKAIGDPPFGPLEPMILAEEPTYEGLVKLFIAGQPSIGLFSDEGGRMIGGHGMSEEQQLKTATGLSELWDGKRISRVRAGDGSMLLYGKRLSMHIMIQPVVANQLLGNELLAGQGLMSRCLTVWPTSTIGSRLYKECDVSSHPTIVQYNDKLSNLLHINPSMRSGKRNELNPPSLSLTLDSKRLYIEFHDRIEGQLKDGNIYSPVKGLGAKIAEHALRLAGCLSLLADMHCTEIKIAEMECGITLGQFYLDEALRIKQGLSDNPDITLAEKLLAWLQSLPNPIFHLAQVYQLGPNSIREASLAKRILSILEQHHWIQRKDPVKIDGAIRRDVWQLRNLS